MCLIKSLMIGRDLDELGRAADQIRVWLEDTLDDDGVSDVELAVVEALTNSILYGPADSRKPIGLFVEVSDSQIAVEIADDSPPMPTLFDGAGEKKLEFDLSDLENLPEGGRGLSLIVVSMNEVTFRQVDDQVRLRMVRYRGG